MPVLFELRLELVRGRAEVFAGLAGLRTVAAAGRRTGAFDAFAAGRLAAGLVGR